MSTSAERQRGGRRQQVGCSRFYAALPRSSIAPPLPSSTGSDRPGVQQKAQERLRAGLSAFNCAAHGPRSEPGLGQALARY